MLPSRAKCVICAFRAADRRLLCLSSTQVRRRSAKTLLPPPTEAVRPPRSIRHGIAPALSEGSGGYEPTRPSFLRFRSPRHGIAPKDNTTIWMDQYYDFIEMHYKTVVVLIEDTTFAPEGTEEGAPRINEIWGITTPEEFRKLAKHYWTNKLKPALRWAAKPAEQKVYQPAEELSQVEWEVQILEYESIFKRLYTALPTGARVTRPIATDILKSMLYHHIQSTVISAAELSHTKNIADFRYPTEWYPAARALQRKIHLHVGPTNSGKTYHALKRLEEAKTGLYAGPLRLLAHEVYSRLNAKGRVCALITGEERRIPDNYGGQMSSCTVEMVPLGTLVEVAVIDEIQMMADEGRGWAWTQAFLGVQAQEVHLCGEVRTIEIIEKLCKLMGEELIIHNYERLTPLECMGKSFGNKFDKLQKGDAIIVFSRVGIHAMKKQVEAETGKRCAVIYGSLPPETRAQQAALFNDQDNDYDYLVASDAVGMGLNLAIRRVIFESTVKFNGKGGYDQLTVSELKQIAGRAGRYKTAAEGMQDSKNEGTREDGTPRHPPRNVGLATTLEPNDHPVLKTAMETDVEPIKQVGIFPPTSAFKAFAAYFPRGTPFTYVVNRLPEIADLSPMYFICSMKDQMAVADKIQTFDLSIEDRMIFMASPTDYKREPEVLIAYASHVAAQSSAELLNLKELEIELLDVEIEGADYLQRLERLHNALTLYLWLSYRFAGVFVSQPLAFHVKALVEEKIDGALSRVAFSTAEQNRRRKLRQMKLEELIAKREREAKESEGAPSPYSSQNEDEQEPLMDPLEEEALEHRLVGGDVVEGDERVTLPENELEDEEEEEAVDVDDSMMEENPESMSPSRRS